MYYFMHDSDYSNNRPYFIAKHEDGKNSILDSSSNSDSLGWGNSFGEILVKKGTLEWITVSNKFLNKDSRSVIHTFDVMPTIDTHPELFI